MNNCSGPDALLCKSMLTLLNVQDRMPFYPCCMWQDEQSRGCQTYRWAQFQRCGGLLVALQTILSQWSQSSNSASLTVKNSEDRQSHSVYCKIFGYRRGNLNLRQKRKRKQFKETILPDSPPFTYVTQLIPYLKEHFLFIIKKPALTVKNGCKLDT